MNRLAPFVKEESAHYITVADEADETEFDEWCDEVACLMEDRYFTEALNEIEDMLEIYAERWEPLYLKGTCLAMLRKPDQAIPLLNQAIAAEPSAEAYLNLATAHQSLFHIEEWITCLRKVVELDGETGSLGHVAKVHIDEFAASILIADGISLDQHFAVGRTYNQAFKDLTTGHFDEAIRGFSEVLKALPHHVQSHGNLGLAYAGQGDRDRAIASFDKRTQRRCRKDALVD